MVSYYLTDLRRKWQWLVELKNVLVRHSGVACVRSFRGTGAWWGGGRRIVLKGSMKKYKLATIRGGFHRYSIVSFLLGV